MDIIKPHIKDLVATFLQNKQRDDYYGFFCLNEFDEEICYLHQLDEEYYASLVKLQDKYGDAMPEHLNEIFTDEDELNDMSFGQKVISVDLKTPFHMYHFAFASIEGDQVSREDTIVDITDEDYISLVCYAIQVKHFNINRLRYLNKDLYERLITKLDRDKSVDGILVARYPYTYEMTEIMEDAKKIMEENGLKYEKGSLAYPQLY